MAALNFQTLSNTIKAAMEPEKARVMIGKVLRRVSDSQGGIPADENRAWLLKKSTPLNDYLKSFPEDVRDEARTFMTDLSTHADKILKAIPYDLGGGAGVPLLYVLVRTRKPEIVVETGVAAGFSSATILTAMDKNEKGQLFSSDFPYFRIPEPEKYVGAVVEEYLKTRWALFIKGDEINLPKIMQQIPDKSVGIFHYDSDKSYKGRELAWSYVKPKLTDDAIIIMDDIQDNAYFHDWVARHADYKWKVFSFGNKYIGAASKTDF